MKVPSSLSLSADLTLPCCLLSDIEHPFRCPACNVGHAGRNRQLSQRCGQHLVERESKHAALWVLLLPGSNMLVASELAGRMLPSWPANGLPFRAADRLELHRPGGVGHPGAAGQHTRAAHRDDCPQVMMGSVRETGDALKPYLDSRSAGDTYEASFLKSFTFLLASSLAACLSRPVRAGARRTHRYD